VGPFFCEGTIRGVIFSFWCNWTLFFTCLVYRIIKKVLHFWLPFIWYILYFVKHSVQPGRRVKSLLRQQFPHCQNKSYNIKDSNLKTNLEKRHCVIWQVKSYLQHLKVCCSWRH
jgi:hypothetical protein